jgi:hypothetical protein
MKYISLKMIESLEWVPSSKAEFKKAFGNEGMPVDYDIVLDFITTRGWDHSWLHNFIDGKSPLSYYDFSVLNSKEAVKMFCELYMDKKSLVDKIVASAYQ